MKILTTITYYEPHISGLTIYAARLAKTLVSMGHEVAMLTSQFNEQLPLEEIREGVYVVRVPVTLRVSKGVIMAQWASYVNRLVAEANVVQMHLPQFEGSIVARAAAARKKPLVATYHCDLDMPRGLVSRLANLGMDWMTRYSLQRADVIVTNTQDYADHSKMLAPYLTKVKVIPPPIELAQNDPFVEKILIERVNPSQRFPVIGIAGRFTTEKGVEVLLDALPEIMDVFPDTLVLFAGPYQKIKGEEAYYDRLSPRIRDLEEQGRWKFLGILPDEEMPAFFKSLDLLATPSLNSTESFGIVQIEAMQNGTPVVASDLPGVRVPAQRHKMGLNFPAGDSKRMAEAVIEVLRNYDSFSLRDEKVVTNYTKSNIANQYLDIFKSILRD